jgi:hypothetical protein
LKHDASDAGSNAELDVSDALLFAGMQLALLCFVLPNQDGNAV